MALEIIGKERFDELTKSDKTVLVDFFATWCGPCKALAPILEEVAAELPEDKIIVKVDVDKEKQLAIKHGVMSIPTMILFKNGTPVSRTVGLRGKEEILDILK